MKVRVLKELPQGQQPGDEVEMHEDQAAVFMLPGIDAVTPIEPPDRPARGRYRRADLQADPRTIEE